MYVSAGKDMFDTTIAQGWYKDDTSVKIPFSSMK
jgi:hypothetical protein